MVSPKRKVERRGFTLMELMIVLAVMGVMMGMIGFSLSGGGGPLCKHPKGSCWVSSSKLGLRPLSMEGLPA